MLNNKRRRSNRNNRGIKLKAEIKQINPNENLKVSSDDKVNEIEQERKNIPKKQINKQNNFFSQMKREIEVILLNNLL